VVAVCKTLDVLFFLSSIGPGSSACPPSYAVWVEANRVRFATNVDSWGSYRTKLSAARDDDRVLYELSADAWRSVVASVACAHGARVVDDITWRPPELQAESLLDRGDEPFGLLFWPALEMYELLDSRDRLVSLGLSDQITEGART
jgi:hypothetical protein